MSGPVDTSDKAVEALAIGCEHYSAEWLVEHGAELAATLRALAAERAALRADLAAAEARTQEAFNLAERHMNEKHKAQRQAKEDWDALQSRIACVEAERDALRARADRLYDALRAVVHAVGGIAQPGVSDDFLCNGTPAEVAAQLAAARREGAEAMRERAARVCEQGKEVPDRRYPDTTVVVDWEDADETAAAIRALAVKGESDAV